MKKYRICMVCESLDLGGAETHVVTLANQLAAMGHEVTVVSEGGRLEKALLGVTFHRLPRFSKRSTLRLFLSLFFFLRKKKFDVVHAHTRFSAFLCRPLARKRLIVTAHWVFETSFPKKQLTFWGNETLAVSPDIAVYLSECYAIRKEKITVTINGIDTKLFFPEKKDTCVRNIVCCTRMDASRADAAFALLDAVRSLPTKEIRITLIGDGDRFEELKQKHQKLLTQDPTLDIRLIGGSSNVAAYLKDADIFIGVSRAALEGMAAGCATILAGNEGYLSIFHPENADMAEKSNFCCRGAKRTTADLITRDLLHLLSLSQEDLRRMGEENRSYVCQRYGAQKMARDALSVYDKICKRVCVLCGYYGFGNVGDALLARALTEHLKKRGYRHVLLLSSKLLSIKAFLALHQGYDLFLGGGNLLQDGTSKRSLSFYLFITSLVKSFEIYGGLGPLSQFGEERVKQTLQHADGIHARTTGDFMYAKKLGASKIHLSADTALALPLPQKRKGRKILLSFRAPSPEKEAAALAFVLHLTRTFGKEDLFLFAMHPQDKKFSKRVSALCGIELKIGDGDDFLSALHDCRAVFSSRLHAGICALGMEIPFLLWKGEEKCRFFVEDVALLCKDSSFCGLFSFSDRPKTLPTEGEIKKARRCMLARI